MYKLYECSCCGTIFAVVNPGTFSRTTFLRRLAKTIPCGYGGEFKQIEDKSIITDWTFRFPSEFKKLSKEHERVIFLPMKDENDMLVGYTPIVR